MNKMSVPLRNKRILITREEKQAKLFSDKIREHGGIPIEVPLLKINCKKIVVDERITALISDCEWLFFTSANGVHCFFNIISGLKNRNRLVANCSIAVVGHKTAETLKKYGYEAHFIPTIYKATVMASEFLKKYPEAQRIILIRGSLASEVLFERFKKRNLSVHVMEVYETIFNHEESLLLNERLENNCIDFLTFTSPSTVNAFIDMVHNQSFLHIPSVCIGPTTKKRAKEQGFTHILVPKQFTIEGMIDRMGSF